MPRAVYLDHHTISRPSPRVIERMNTYFQEKWGTLSAPHQKGIELASDIDQSLKKLYENLGLSNQHYFMLTSGGTEAIFQMLMNFYLDEVRETGKNHFLSVSNEEGPILLSLSRMEELGCATKLLPIDEHGYVRLEEAFKPKTSLLSLSWAHPLTGVIQPISEIVQACHAQGVKVHVNASHAIGKIPFSLEGIDFISFEGDKMHTPPGIGGIIQRKKTQRQNYHAAALAGLSIAVEDQLQRLEQFSLETARLRDTFETELKYALPDTHVLFQESNRLPSVSAVVFPGVMSEALLYTLHRRQVYATIGSGQYQKLSSPSAISFALSHETTEDDLAHALDVIVASVRQLSTLSGGL